MQLGACSFFARTALTLNNSAELHHAKQNRIPLLLRKFLCCQLLKSQTIYFALYLYDSPPMLHQLISNITDFSGGLCSKMCFFNILSFPLCKVWGVFFHTHPSALRSQSLNKPPHALFVLVILTQGLYLRILFVQLWTRFSTWRGG